MINSKLQVAFLGGGINSVVGSAHVAAINLDNNFNLVAGLFSRNEDVNRQSGEFYNVMADRVYSSLSELIMFEKSKIDAVIVLTPTDQHAAQVKELLNCDIPVICEKALTSTAHEAEQIRSLIEKKNGFLAVVYNYLGYPLIRELKFLIDSGTLGNICHIQIEMPQESFARTNIDNVLKTPQSWRLKDGNVPTISLDLGVHLHMFVKYLTNEVPINVVAKSETCGGFSNIVDNVNCIIEYSNNISCHMWYSKVAIGNRNGLKLRVFGDKASAAWEQIFPGIIALSDSMGRRWKLDRGNEEAVICNQKRYTRFKAGHPTGFIEAFSNYYYDVAVALKKYRQECVVDLDQCFGVDEALEGIKLFEAIEKSSQSKCWMKV